MAFKNALIVEGGALRSVFSAGILDRFLDAGFNPFDLCIGVSAGAANLLFYLSGQPGLGIELFRQAAADPAFISARRFLRGGHFIDLDWLFEQFHKEYTTANANIGQQSLLVGMTRVAHGDALFVDVRSGKLADSLKASMALPLLYRGFPQYQGEEMTDGGISNGIPADEAIRLGAKNIMVIRSRPVDYKKTDTLWHRYIRHQLKHHQNLVAVMRERVSLHEQQKQLLASPPKDIHIVDVCPPRQFDAGRFNRKPTTLQSGYQLGWQSALAAMESWSSTASKQ